MDALHSVYFGEIVSVKTLFFVFKSKLYILKNILIMVEIFEPWKVESSKLKFFLIMSFFF